MASPQTTAEDNEANPPERRGLLSVLGPGLITGASDDDPSGIATYSQAGAQFGFALSWVMLFSWPLMCAIQEISARIGRVTGRGIAGNIKQHYPAPVLFGIVGLLVVANTINLGADIGAMAAALKLLLGGPELVYVGLFALGSLLLEIFATYARYVSILKWLTLSLFNYVAVAIVVSVPWGDVARDLFIPRFTSDKAYLTVVVAILGTTISPYLFSGRLRKRWKRSRNVQVPNRWRERRSRQGANSDGSGSILCSEWVFPMPLPCSS